MRKAGLSGRCYPVISSLFLVLAGAQATEFYVSDQGNDANAGTAARPFRTISHAYRTAAPGTTIHVLPGVYYDYTSRWGIHLDKSGSASSPIVLRSQIRQGAVIDGRNGADRHLGLYIDGSYNVVEGFEIRNCPDGGIAIYGNGNRILHNEIHHNGNPASSSTDGKDGVYSNEGTKDNYYGANSIHDNGRPGNKLDHGLYLCGQNETVINNLLYRNAGSGLQIAGYTTVRNMKVYNNVMAWNGTDGIILWMALRGVEIKNNILYHNRRWGLGSCAAHGSGVVVDHNQAFGNGQGAFDFTGEGSDYTYTLGTTISVEPRFVNGTSAGFDARLAPDSPAIRAGLNLHSVFASAKDGVARPAAGPWDLGAYVHVGTNKPPPVSTSADAP